MEKEGKRRSVYDVMLWVTLCLAANILGQRAGAGLSLLECPGTFKEYNANIMPEIVEIEEGVMQ